MLGQGRRGRGSQLGPSGDAQVIVDGPDNDIPALEPHPGAYSPVEHGLGEVMVVLDAEGAEISAFRADLVEKIAHAIAARRRARPRETPPSRRDFRVNVA